MAMSIRSSMSSPCSSRHLQASVLRPSCLSNNHRDRCCFLKNRSFLQPLIMKVESGSQKKMTVVVNTVEPGTPLPSAPSDTDWKPWLVWMLFSVVIPLWKKIKELDTVEGVEKKLPAAVMDEIVKIAAREAGQDASQRLSKSTTSWIGSLRKEVEDKVDWIIEKVEEDNNIEGQTAEIKKKKAEIKETSAIKEKRD